MTRALRRLHVRRAPRNRGLGILRASPLAIVCALGPAGISPRKREGDGATPAGRFGLVHGLVRTDRLSMPRSLVPVSAMRADDGWCDDPGSPAYNRPVRTPFRYSHEKLWRDDRLYDVCLVLDFNRRPRRRGGGSAIFIHLAHDDMRPTQGCIAIAPAAMRRLLPRLARGVEVVVHV